MKCDFAWRIVHGIVPVLYGFGQACLMDRALRKPTEAEIAAINARHLVETPLRPADLLFVFGTRVDVAQRVEEACRLWRGIFPLGGRQRRTPGSDLSECEIIAGAMVERGVPADIEHRSDHKLTVFSTNCQTIALMVPQDREYRAFIGELHER